MSLYWLVALTNVINFIVNATVMNSAFFENLYRARTCGEYIWNSAPDRSSKYTANSERWWYSDGPRSILTAFALPRAVVVSPLNDAIEAGSTSSIVAAIVRTPDLRITRSEEHTS